MYFKDEKINHGDPAWSRMVPKHNQNNSIQPGPIRHDDAREPGAHQPKVVANWVGLGSAKPPPALLVPSFGAKTSRAKPTSMEEELAPRRNMSLLSTPM
jgi:hypothetical protein